MTSQSDFLNRAAADAEAWVGEVAVNLGHEDRGRGYSALRAVLQSIRDFLPFDEALRLSHQLPVIVRGIYFEGWTPGKSGGFRVSDESFLTVVAERLNGVVDLDPDDAVDAVFRLLQVRLPREMADAANRGWPAFFPTSESKPAKPRDTVREIEDVMDRAVLEGASTRDLPRFIEKPKSTDRRRRESEGPVFAPALQKANLWLKELMEHLALADRTEALAIFQAVMHSLRDRLARDEAFHLGAQMPAVLRGYYYEGWTADPSPSEERTLEDFRADVLERLLGLSSLPLDEAISGVFRLLSDRMSAGEVSDVRGRLPEAIRDLWPAEWVRFEGSPAVPRTESRPTARKARKEIRTILARGRARGLRGRDLPTLASRRRSNKSRRTPSK